MTRLRVEGAVQFPNDFGFAELAALPEQIEDVATLIPGREGGGVALRAILAAVGVKPEATHVELSSSDGRFSASVPLAALGEAIVAYRLGHEPLPAGKGGPLRFFIPDVEQCAIGGVDACANVKFLGMIRLTVGAGVDTRPTSEQAHAALHRDA